MLLMVVGGLSTLGTMMASVWLTKKYRERMVDKDTPWRDYLVGFCVTLLVGVWVTFYIDIVFGGYYLAIVGLCVPYVAAQYIVNGPRDLRT